MVMFMKDYMRVQKKSELNERDPFSGYEHIKDLIDKKFLASKL